MLKHAIGEATCRSADVKAVQTFDGEAEVLKGTLEFLAASTYESWLCRKCDFDVVGKGMACFCRELPIDKDFSGQDEFLGEFA